MCGPHPRSTPFREGRERLIFAFCVCFLCKVQGARPREMAVLEGDGFRSFFSEFSAGDARLRMRLSQNFSQPNGDRPVPIGQREATTGFF